MRLWLACVCVTWQQSLPVFLKTEVVELLAFWSSTKAHTCESWLFCTRRRSVWNFESSGNGPTFNRIRYLFTSSHAAVPPICINIIYILYIYAYMHIYIYIYRNALWWFGERTPHHPPPHTTTTTNSGANRFWSALLRRGRCPNTHKHMKLYCNCASSVLLAATSKVRFFFGYDFSFAALNIFHPKMYWYCLLVFLIYLAEFVLSTRIFPTEFVLTVLTIRADNSCWYIGCVWNT